MRCMLNRGFTTVGMTLAALTGIKHRRTWLFPGLRLFIPG